VEKSRRIEFLINRYSKPLVRYAIGMIKDKVAAQEIVQQCLLQLVRQEPTPPRDAIQVWLYRECRERCLDVYRKNLKPGSPSEPAVFLDPMLESNTAVTLDKSSPLTKAARDLSPRHQEIFWLRYRDGLSPQEIADVLNLTPGHVGSLLVESTGRLGPFTGRDFADRAREGLNPSQLASLQICRSTVFPSRWRSGLTGSLFGMVAIAGILFYFLQREILQFQAIPGDENSPPVARDERVHVTEVPAELEREFAAARNDTPTPPSMSQLRRQRAPASKGKIKRKSMGVAKRDIQPGPTHAKARRKGPQHSLPTQ
jgi:RNA polymerase sigma factor (sigma-70 family)